MTEQTVSGLRSLPVFLSLPLRATLVTNVTTGNTSYSMQEMSSSATKISRNSIDVDLHQAVLAPWLLSRVE